VNRIGCTLRAWLGVVAIVAVSLATMTFLRAWLQEMHEVRRVRLNVSARYARDEASLRAALQHQNYALERQKVRMSESLEDLRRSGMSQRHLSEMAAFNNRILEEVGALNNIVLEEINYAASMKQLYLDAASRPWKKELPYVPRSSYASARKKGLDAK
jgi:hypothetical protein